MARSRLYPPSVDPGFPRLPTTPTGWSRTTFGQVLEVAERPVALEPTRTYRLVNAKRSRGGIVLRTKLLGREILTKTQFETKGGDFLISRRQIIHGACGIVPDDLDGAVVSNEYSTLRATALLSMDYLKHYCHTPYFQRTCFHSSHGVDVEKMIFKIEEWLAREVDLPPLPEQRKIAAILSSADEAIEATQAVIDQLQVVKKAMMAELLTRGIPGRHTKFKMTEIGEVPEEWGVVQAQELAIPKGMVGGPFGSDLTAEDYISEADGVPVIRGGNVSMGDFHETDFVYVSPTKAEALSRNTACPGDIVMTQRGVSLGESALVPLNSRYSRYVISQTMMRLRPDSTRLAPLFLLYCLCGPVAQAWLSRHQIATGQPHINLGIFRELPIALPSRSEQEEIAAIIDSVMRAIRSNIEEQVTLASVKASLMSVLLTGEVRVTPYEDLV